MSLNPRERRLLLLLAPALLLALMLRYTVFADPTSSSTAGASANASDDGIRLAQLRLNRLRQVAATLPAREATAKQVASDLAGREKGIIHADTAPQAQARLLEIARQIGKAEQIDVRGGELGAPKAFGDYGLVYATVTFECHIEQLVNFLAALSRQTERIAPSEERISSGNPKEKLMNVRMVLAGVVPRKLVPEKKGLSTF